MDLSFCYDCFILESKALCGLKLEAKGMCRCFHDISFGKPDVSFGALESFDADHDDGEVVAT